MKHFVEIHIPGSSAQRHELLGNRTTLGTGAEASIRVSESSGLAAEQVELFTGDQVVSVQVPTGSKGALVFEGSEHRKVSVPWGGELFVGNVRLTFLRDSKASRTSPVLLLLAPVVFIALGLGAYRAASQNDVSAREVPAPVLFDDRQVGQCPERESSIAEHRARDHERAALAKEERSAFDATDGVDAVSLFREAQACFQLAGKADDVTRVANEFTQWSGQLNEQYATLRLQLKVALDKQRHADALAAVKELQALLAHQEEGPYRQWLGQLSRTLEQKLAQPKS
jgi:hypothetical protein